LFYINAKWRLFVFVCFLFKPAWSWSVHTTQSKSCVDLWPIFRTSRLLCKGYCYPTEIMKYSKAPPLGPSAKSTITITNASPLNKRRRLENYQKCSIAYTEKLENCRKSIKKTNKRKRGNQRYFFVEYRSLLFTMIESYLREGYEILLKYYYFLFETKFSNGKYYH